MPLRTDGKQEEAQDDGPYHPKRRLLLTCRLWCVVLGEFRGAFVLEFPMIASLSDSSNHQRQTTGRDRIEMMILPGC